MYTLVFLICIANGDCSVQSYDTPFVNVDHCHAIAKELIEINRQRQEDGLVPPHTARYSCVDFGEQV